MAFSTVEEEHSIDLPLLPVLAEYTAPLTENFQEETRQVSARLPASNSQNTAVT